MLHCFRVLLKQKCRFVVLPRNQDVFPCQLTETASPSLTLKAPVLNVKLFNFNSNNFYSTFNNVHGHKAASHKYIDSIWSFYINKIFSCVTGQANGKYSCPKIYFNHRCFSGPYLNKGRIAELPQCVGPGNCVLVLKEVCILSLNVSVTLRSMPLFLILLFSLVFCSPLLCLLYSFLCCFIRLWSLMTS